MRRVHGRLVIRVARVAGVCNETRLAGTSAADSELATRLRLSIQLARWDLFSIVSEVKA